MSTDRVFAESLDLLKRAHAGESQALDALLARYSDRLLERVRLMMGEQARAQAESIDFLQMTLLDVVRDFGRFEVRDERAFLRWLTTIARNRIRDSVRRRREVALEELSSTCSSHGGDGAREKPTPATEAADNEQVMRLVEGLEELDGELRQIIELRDLEGLTFSDVGERLGLDEDRVRYLHRKAVLRLGRQLG